MTDKKSVLQEAEELIHGARQQTYDHPYIDFGRTAKMLSGLLKSKLKDDVEIEIEDVPLIMVCVKLSRLMATPGHRDSMVDGPGYFGTYEMVMDKKQELEDLYRGILGSDEAVEQFKGHMTKEQYHNRPAGLLRDQINRLMEHEREYQNSRVVEAIKEIGDDDPI